MTVFEKISTLIDACNEVNIQTSRWKLSYRFGGSSKTFTISLTRDYQHRPAIRYIKDKVLFTDIMSDEDFQDAQQFVADIMLRVLNEVVDDKTCTS